MSTVLPADWPPVVRGWLRETLGPQSRIAPLGGMSGGQVARVSSDTGSVIVKASENPAESRFYDQTAAHLRAAGIGIPTRYQAVHESGRHWLILEDIPTPLPRAGADGLPDDRVIHTLARLHALSLPAPQEAWWLPRWPAGMTARALTALGHRTPALDADLRVIRDRAQRLFAPRCWLSGDPNPGNWGVRADGTAVLFDWERFGRGAPAIDLAITIAGLGDRAAYQELAARAVRIAPTYGAVDELARQIALAKCWTAVELLASVTSGQAQVPERTLAYLRERAPGWIPAVRAMTG